MAAGALRELAYVLRPDWIELAIRLDKELDTAAIADTDVIVPLGFRGFFPGRMARVRCFFCLEIMVWDTVMIWTVHLLRLRPCSLSAFMLGNLARKY